jgi:predicted deacylase
MGVKTLRFIWIAGLVLVLGLAACNLPVGLAGALATFTPLPTHTFPAPSRTPLPTSTPTLPPPTTTSTASITLTALPSATPTLTPTRAEGEPFVIGFTVNGLPIEVVRFGQGPSRRMIVAGIHGGNEFNTIALANRLSAYLRQNPAAVPAGVTLYILNDLNPDGEAQSYGDAGRANANGVDLNRNWDVRWQADWPHAGCWDVGPISGGTAPFSEPETRALRDFLLANPMQALISYHSAGLGVFPDGIPPTSDSERLARAVAGVSSYAYPPKDFGCLYTGQLIDWAAGQGIASVDIELTNHTEPTTP